MSGTYFLSMNHVAANLRAERARKGWSQPRLSEECQRIGTPVSVSTIVRIERDGNARFDQIEAFATALGVPVDRLTAVSDSAQQNGSGSPIGSVDHQSPSRESASSVEPSVGAEARPATKVA